MKKPIFLGLAFILAVILMPTPQRPTYCGGGSVIWNKQKVPSNAEHIKTVIAERLVTEGLEHEPKINYDKLYWNKQDNGRIMVCQKIGKYGERTWVFDSDSVNVSIIEETVTVGGF